MIVKEKTYTEEEVANLGGKWSVDNFKIVVDGIAKDLQNVKEPCTLWVNLDMASLMSIIGSLTFNESLDDVTDPLFCGDFSYDEDKNIQVSIDLKKTGPFFYYSIETL